MAAIPPANHARAACGEWWARVMLQKSPRKKVTTGRQKPIPGHTIKHTSNFCRADSTLYMLARYRRKVEVICVSDLLENFGPLENFGTYAAASRPPPEVSSLRRGDNLELELVKEGDKMQARHDCSLQLFHWHYAPP